MPVYLVSYDLVKEKDGHDYAPLWDEMKRLGAHRTQYSAWLVNLNNTPKEVVEHFARFVDRDDRVMAVEMLRGRYTFTKANSGTNDWLKQNPARSL